MIQLSPGGAYEILRPLILLIVGLAVYAIVVYNLYKFVATRDIFNLNLGQYNRVEHAFLFKFFALLLYILEYLLFFPLFLMVWFVAFAVIFMAQSPDSIVSNILLISMAMIAAIRIASYYRQDLAKDIAKLIPFALLAFFLIDGVGAFDWTQSWSLIMQVPSLLDTLIYYFVFVFALELILRVVYSMTRALSSRDENT
jgi:hypothetical protein